MREARGFGGGLVFDFVFEHFVVEEAAIDLEACGGFGFVSGRLAEGVLDEVAFDFGDGVVEGEGEEVGGNAVGGGV